MKEPHFLTTVDVLHIHQDQIENYGGEPGLRDLNLLLSAISQPQQSFGNEYLHGDLFEMAAAYLFHLCKNHPFVDGNKRVGLASALVFLEINGIAMPYSAKLYDLTIKAASGKIEKSMIAIEFKKLSS